MVGGKKRKGREEKERKGNRKKQGSIWYN